VRRPRASGQARGAKRKRGRQARDEDAWHKMAITAIGEVSPSPGCSRQMRQPTVARRESA
jgi:hypothetical protein